MKERTISHTGPALLALAVLALITGCADEQAEAPPPLETQRETRLELTSPAFADGQPIPDKYASGAEGDATNPPLEWSNVPEGTRSLALTMIDPDAPGGTFVHWAVYNIPPDQNRIPEGIMTVDAEHLEQLGGAALGDNTNGETTYFPPTPPPGEKHRYEFRLYALDTNLNLQPHLDRSALREQMVGHVIDVAELTGTYRRAE